MDLLGVVRSKLVPLSAIQTMERTGAGFAGYAAHFLMTAADSDMVDVYCLLHVRIVNSSQKQKWNSFGIDVQVTWTSTFLNQKTLNSIVVAEYAHGTFEHSVWFRHPEVYKFVYGVCCIASASKPKRPECCEGD